MQLVEIANGYQLTTRSEYANWIKKLNKIKVSTKLSKPAMETLAIIAYKQPIIKPEVEKIRGVDSGGVIKTLLERKTYKDNRQDGYCRQAHDVRNNAGIFTVFWSKGFDRPSNIKGVSGVKGGGNSCSCLCRSIR